MEAKTTDHHFVMMCKWVGKRLREMPLGLRILLYTIVIGLLTHGFVYTNTLFGHDNTVPYYHSFTAPRWAGWIFFMSRAYLQMPWLIGAIALVEFSIVIYYLVKILHIENFLSQLMLTAIVMTFPTVIAMHNYGAVDMYSGTLLLAVLSAYFAMKKGVWSWLLALLLLTVSIGSYQAYVCVTAILLLLHLLRILTIENVALKQAVLAFFKFSSLLVLAVILYFLVYKFAAMITDNSGVNSYRGVNEMGFFTVPQVLLWIQSAYQTVLHYFSGFDVYPFPQWLGVLQIGCLIIVFGMTTFSLYQRGFFKEPMRLLLTLIALLLLPLFMNAIQVLNNGIKPHTLMIFSFIAPWLMVIQYGEWSYCQAMDNPTVRRVSVSRICAIACAILMSFTVYYSYLAANADYLARKLNYDSSISLATRIIDRIENTDGYTVGTPVVLYGSVTVRTQYYPMRRGFDISANITGSLSKAGHAMVYNTSLGSTPTWFIQDVLGANVNILSFADSASYYNLEIVQQLEAFPAQDCYAWVDGVLVMKLGK